MLKSKPKIMVIEDEESMLVTYRSILKTHYDVTLKNNPKVGLEILEKENYALIILDMMMPGMNGIEVLKRIKEIDNNLEVLIVTAMREIKLAVQAIKLGAYDYITKPFEADELMSIVEKALEKRSLVRENMYLRQALEEKGPYLDFIGKTDEIKKVFELINKIALTDSTVLITGESGTGKELAARAIHKKSPRAQKPFVVVNCAALPDSLIESELFGHERGAFTSAIGRKEGKFELADEGTIFLDEIGCLPIPMQSRLLRVLQDNCVERIGSVKPIQVNVRVIAATNMKIEEAIKNREFREDLYYRLNVIRVHMPPLRDRREDIPRILNYYLEKYNVEFNKKISGFSPETLMILSDYDWPGNIRELQNLVERIVVLSETDKLITPEDIQVENAPRNLAKKGLKEASMDFEKRYIKNVLAETRDNQTRAAEILGIHRTTLISKMTQLGLK